MVSQKWMRTWGISKHVVSSFLTQLIVEESVYLFWPVDYSYQKENDEKRFLRRTRSNCGQNLEL